MNNNDDSTVYIYALRDPRDEQVLYIGQTANLSQRFRRHLTEKGISNRKRAWLDELRLLGLAPVMEVVEECHKGDVDEREIHWIAHHRNLHRNLLNVSAGGAWQGAWTHTDETKKNISDAKKGCTFTDEHKKKLSDAHKGHCHTDESKKKMSDAQKGRTHTDETKKKMSDSAKGRPLTDEHKKKLSDSRKGRIITDETKKKISDSGKGRTVTEETRKKISDANKGRTLTDETKKKMSDSQKGRTLTDEHKKNMSDGQKGKPHPRSQKPVAQYGLDGSFIQQFPSFKEASEKTGIAVSHISACANNRRSCRQAGGYQWKKVVGDALMIIEPVRPRLAIVSEETRLKMSISGKKRYQK